MLSQTERWIYLYEIVFNTRPAEAEAAGTIRFTPLEAFGSLKDRVEAGASVKLMNSETAAMRICDLRIDDVTGFIDVLLMYSDMNMADPAFSDLETGTLRISPKLEGEGVCVSAHLVICANADPQYGYLCALENVPGVTKTRIQDFLSSELKTSSEWTYESMSGEAEPVNEFETHAVHNLS